jgi:hypothetical protein
METTTRETGTTVTDRAVILCLSLTGITNGSAIDPEKLGVDADVSMLHASKRLLRSDELDRVRRGDAKIRARVRAKSLPSLLRDGMHLVALGMVDEIDAEIRAAQEKRDEDVEAFIDALPDRVAEAEQALGELFDIDDYPGVVKTDSGYAMTDGGREAVRALFEIRYRFIEVTAPGKLGSLSAELFRREKAKAQAELERLAENCRVVLRAEMQGLLAHMVDRLTPGVDGMPKKFKNCLVPNFLEGLRLIKGREITDDAELRTLLDRAEKLAGNVDSALLRDWDDEREKAQREFASIKSRLDDMIEAAPRRFFEGVRCPTRCRLT